MLKQLFQSVTAMSKVYDTIQYLAGVGYLHRRLKAQLFQIPLDNSIILDLGGGTGILKHIVHPTINYICLDIDSRKLEGFRLKYPDGTAIIADGTCLPFQNESIDIIFCTFVTHHLDTGSLRHLVSESARVLIRKGRMLLLDPVWIPNRLPGVLLWKYDQGSYPRTESDLTNSIMVNYEILYKERIAIFHEYILYVAVKI
jgi:ubiquinone/menaquinone biosynthesis C-methylase UbiE